MSRANSIYDIKQRHDTDQHAVARVRNCASRSTGCREPAPRVCYGVAVAQAAAAHQSASARDRAKSTSLTSLIRKKQKESTERHATTVDGWAVETISCCEHASKVGRG